MDELQTAFMNVVSEVRKLNGAYARLESRQPNDAPDLLCIWMDRFDPPVAARQKTRVPLMRVC